MGGTGGGYGGEIRGGERGGGDFLPTILQMPKRCQFSICCFSPVDVYFPGRGRFSGRSPAKLPLGAVPALRRNAPFVCPFVEVTFVALRRNDELR